MARNEQEDNVLNLKICCAKYMSLAPIFEELNEQNLPYANIKGEILSLYAFGQYGERSYGDIDILVSRKNLHKLEKILTQHGYMSSTKTRTEKVLLITSSHQTAVWQKKTCHNFHSIVDINFDIFWGEYTGARIDIDQFLSDTVEREVYGVYVKTLTPLKALVQLILHHYKEMNSIYLMTQHDCIRYDMFKDVYYLWKNNKSIISLEKLYALSSEYGIIPYVFYVLYFTNEIYNDDDLSQYIEAFRTPDGLALLDYYGLSDSERKLWKVDFKTRLESESIGALIKNELTEQDFIKIERNKMIFR